MKTALIVFSAICLGALGIGTYEASRHLGREWRVVPAHFIEYETLYRSKGTRAAYPAIHYSYQIDGRIYHAKDTSLLGRRYPDAAAAEAAAFSAYDRNKLVAYYDVRALETSDLNPVTEATAWSYIYVPALILLAGWGFAYLAPKLKLNDLLRSKR